MENAVPAFFLLSSSSFFLILRILNNAAYLFFFFFLLLFLRLRFWIYIHVFRMFVIRRRASQTLFPLKQHRCLGNRDINLENKMTFPSFALVSLKRIHYWNIARFFCQIFPPRNKADDVAGLSKFCKFSTRREALFDWKVSSLVRGNISKEKKILSFPSVRGGKIRRDKIHNVTFMRCKI